MVVGQMFNPRRKFKHFSGVFDRSDLFEITSISYSTQMFDFDVNVNKATGGSCKISMPFTSVMRHLKPISGKEHIITGQRWNAENDMVMSGGKVIYKGDSIEIFDVNHNKSTVEVDVWGKMGNFRCDDMLFADLFDFCTVSSPYHPTQSTSKKSYPPGYTVTPKAPNIGDLYKPKAPFANAGFAYDIEYVGVRYEQESSTRPFTDKFCVCGNKEVEL